jgi:hypothetical protein
MPKRLLKSKAAAKVALIDKPAHRERKGATEDSVHTAIYDAVMDHRLPPDVKRPRVIHHPKPTRTKP